MTLATGRRATCPLDGEWRFVADPERLHAPDRLPAGESIVVPGVWEAQVGRPNRIVSAWYAREFDVPQDWEGDRVVLRFGAVMYACTVYVNGQEAGRHEGGYTPFELELAGLVRFGEPSALVVHVVNPLNALDKYPAFSLGDLAAAEALEPDMPLAEVPHGKQTWYSSQSGIWQSVTLERRPSTALAPLRVVPDVAASSATVSWALDGAGAASAGRDRFAVELTVIDPDGLEVAHASQTTAGESAGEIRVAIPDPRLWDIGQPNLYRVRARLVAGGAVLDEVEARFGMREIRTEAGRILLNGRPIYLLAALDQDLYPDSIATPPSREYLDEQMRLAREMGLNLLRCHIKVPDPRYLDAADEAGILLWCELPNWMRLTPAAAARGRATLETMVREMGNHPSIVIWTIINEDWGTQLRHEARDRRWLRQTYDWLKGLDPTRLVVDNSPCETPTTPNFHVRTDLADFHVYFLAPDNAIRWRGKVADFARRPPWLWSPNGDAEPQGDEPLVLSEFGSWGLPRLDRLVAHHGGEPWWFDTGRDFYRPSGVARRFEAHGLDRVWPTVEALAEATQWHQFEALQDEVGQLRRHDAIQGYVITELTDAYWEANGLLDAMRGPKAYHERLRALNAPDVVVAEPARRDLWGGEAFEAEVTLSSYGGASAGGLVLWQLEVEGVASVRGEIAVADWPDGGARSLGRIRVDVPDVARTSDARLVLHAVDADGTERAANDLRLAVLPGSARRSASPLDIAVVDPMDLWGVGSRVEGLGHRIVEPSSARLVVATELTPDVHRHVEAGGRALLLVRSRTALPDTHDLTRRVDAHLRRQARDGWPGDRSPWDGDWVTAWSWLVPEAFANLPARNPLDFAYEEVIPDHVLLGYDPARHRDEVAAGMFVGWVHAPAALVWSFDQGRGAVTLTTFRVAPESGPVATALLEGLIQAAAGATPRA